jgi:hypothetical protein
VVSPDEILDKTRMGVPSLEGGDVLLDPVKPGKKSALFFRDPPNQSRAGVSCFCSAIAAPGRSGVVPA